MRRRLLRIVPILALMAVPLILLRLPSVRAQLAALVAYMREAGLLGVLLFMGVESAVLVITTPLWLMSGLAGYAYGFTKGLAVAWIGVTVGVCVGFLLGRVLLGKILTQRAGQGEFWRALERAVRTQGLKVTLLMRLAFAFPQNLGTYMLSATSLRLRDFALGSFLGLFPATLFQVYVGASVESAAALIAGDAAPKGPLKIVAIAGGLVMTLAVLVIIARMARRALDKSLREATTSSAEADASPAEAAASPGEA